MNNMDSAILHRIYCALLALSPIPRSLEYRNGTLSALLFRYQGRALANPYRLGTSDSDAFLAGVDDASNKLACVTQGKSFPGSQSLEALLNPLPSVREKTSCEVTPVDRGLPL